MLFSAKAEYACVAMLELAARYADPQPVRLADIANKHGISDRFLVQILLDLKRAGLVDSTRGAAGGYQLARNPDDITLDDILRVDRPARATGPQGRQAEPDRLRPQRSRGLGPRRRGVSKPYSKTPTSPTSCAERGNTVRDLTESRGQRSEARDQQHRLIIDL